MKLIGQPKPFTPSHVFIEEFHRVALGLETGTRLYLTAVPREGDPAPPDRYNEILLTTFHPDTWMWLWRIEFSCKEEPGIMAESLGLLKVMCEDIERGYCDSEDEGRHANIHLLETLTTENGKYHEASLVVDMRPFSKWIGKMKDKVARSRSSTRSWNLGEIAARSLRKRFEQYTEDLSVRWCRAQPMHRLQKAANARTEAIENNMPADYFEGRIERGFLKYDEKELISLLGSQKPKEPHPPSRIAMYSDTEEKYIALSFPRHKSVLLQGRIDHFDRPGALKDFADSFNSNGANITTSYSRIERGGSHTEQRGSRAQWVLTAELNQDHGPGDPEFKGAKELLAAIRDRPKYIDTQRFHLNYEPQELDAKQRIAFKTCPFHFTDGLIRGGMFKGREHILEPITGATVLASATLDQNFLISGYYKTGKSCLLIHICNSIKSHNKEVDGSSARGAGAATTHYSANPQIPQGRMRRSFAWSWAIARSVLSKWSDSNAKGAIKSSNEGGTRKILAVHVNLSEVTDSENFFTSLLDRAEEAIDSTKPPRLSKPLRESPLSPSNYIQWTDGSFGVQSREVRLVFKKLLALANRNGYRSIVFLLDEAQHAIHDLEQEDHLLEIWRVLVDDIRHIRWVVASSRDWKYQAEVRSGLVSKLVALELGPLTPAAARELVERPFQDLCLHVGEGAGVASKSFPIEVHKEALQLIESLTGNQPCYIQAVCRFVFDEIALAPPVVNIITRNMVLEVIPRVTRALGHHFFQMYADLCTVLPPGLVHDLLRGGTRTMTKDEFDPIRDGVDRVRNAVAYSAIPGLIVHQNVQGLSSLATCRLFQLWAIHAGPLTQETTIDA